MQAPLSSPDITDLERRYVNQVLDTHQLSLGPKLEEFECRMAEFVGTKYAVAVSSGTAALHLSGNVLVKEGADLGTGATVIQGLTIGKWSVIGANASVIKDIPDYVTAVGVPAKVIKEHKPD